MTPEWIALVVAVIVTLVVLFAVAFTALILSVRRAQEKIDEQREVIGSYRSERQEAIDAYNRR